MVLITTRTVRLGPRTVRPDALCFTYQETEVRRSPPRVGRRAFCPAIPVRRIEGAYLPFTHPKLISRSLSRFTLPLPPDAMGGA